MGGVRISDQDDFILGMKMMLWAFGRIARFVLLIAGAVLSAYRYKRKSHEQIGRPPEGTVRSIGWSPLTLAVLSLAAGGLLLLFGQQEQRHRWQAEQLLHDGQLSHAVAYVISQSRESFPPHWNPPPRTAYGEDQSRAADVFTVIKEDGGPNWIREIYLEKMMTQHTIIEAITAAEDGDARLLIDILDYLELDSREDEFAWQLRNSLELGGDKLDPEVRQRITEFLCEPD